MYARQNVKNIIENKFNLNTISILLFGSNENNIV